MTRHWLIAALLLLGLAANGPAQACRRYAPVDPADVRKAGAVVIGRVVDYRIVRNEEFRRKMLADPKLPADLRAIYESKTATLTSDHARFDILVDRLLAGRAGGRIAVSWHNSTFSLPREMAAGPMLIALRPPSPARPLVRTMLQAPCSSPFMFPIGSKEALAVRRILSAGRR